MMPPSETAARSDSVGCAVPCGDILVMDEAGREVPAGQEGELWLGGPMVVKGYWDDPAATAEHIVGGYWRSGDIGSMDAEGYVRVLDRKKDMINRGGYKIASVEVENALMSYPGVVVMPGSPSRRCPHGRCHPGRLPGRHRGRRPRGRPARTR